MQKIQRGPNSLPTTALVVSAWVKPLGFVNSRDFIDFSSLDAKGELKINVIYSIVAKNVKNVMHFLGL